MSTKFTTPFKPEETALAEKFCAFNQNSPSQFHVVASSIAELEAAGFKPLNEKDAKWAIVPGGKYYYTRNQSSIMAFAVGGKWKPGNGFTMTVAHTDSPVLKIKPISKIEKTGYLQVGVELYGGGLWYTWFDRDLSVAGRVIVATKDGKFESRLVKIARPILRVPSLAIHLNRDVDTKGFCPNKETQVKPILATVVADQLGAKAKGREDPAFPERHHSVLIELLAAELKVEPEAIKDFEMSLYDVQPACLGGAYNEFIFSRALDNQMMSFVSLQALIASSKDGSNLANEEMIRLVGLFDHEECGSQSLMGAGSNHMYQLLNRLNADPATFDACIARSFMVSADMAHGVHPNYTEYHEDQHRPHLHKGLVIKTNTNQRYATSGFSAFLLREIARQQKVPVQEFVVRNDIACGSTVGPMLATSTGVRTVDVGIPQLAMHSIREMCGVGDVYSSFQLLCAYYIEFCALDKKMIVKGE